MIVLSFFQFNLLGNEQYSFWYFFSYVDFGGYNCIGLKDLVIDWLVQVVVEVDLWVVLEIVVCVFDWVL